MGVVVWELGGALLAVRIEHVLEVAPVDEDGTVRARHGPVELVLPPGLAPASAPVRAVVLTGGARVVAVPAETVEGVRECDEAAVAEPPPWLAALATAAFPAVVRLDDQRIAALLDPAALVDGP